MNFREATDELLAVGVTVEAMAVAAGVTANTITRARTAATHRRTPPREWRSMVRGLAWRRAGELQEQARKAALLAGSLDEA